MKRWVFAVAVLVALGLGAFVVQQPEPGLEWRSFQPLFKDTLQRSGFTVIAEQSLSPDEVPLPLIVQWHPRRLLSQRPHFVSGFPNGAERYVISRDGTTGIDCLVRYLDGRAVVIVVRSGRPQRCCIKFISIGS